MCRCKGKFSTPKLLRGKLGQWMAALLGHILLENTPWPSRNSFAALSMSVRSRAMVFVARCLWFGPVC